MYRKYKDNIVLNKLLFTLLIIFVYVLGKYIPLYGIDVSALNNDEMYTQNVLLQSIGGDLSQSSLFALGFSPFIFSSMLCQIVFALRNSDKKSKISPKLINYVTLLITLIFSFFLAKSRMKDFSYSLNGIGIGLVFNKLIVLLELITGVLVIIYLSDRNQMYGIGGRSALIFVNILESMISSVLKSDFDKRSYITIIISLCGLVIMLLMENTEKRIPVQRISIHNIYADKDYIALKLNPIGVMPMMFAASAFMLPQIVIKYLVDLFPKNSNLQWLFINYDMNTKFGLLFYVILIFILTFSLSFIMINPSKISDDFMKAGDSIINIAPGKKMKRYLIGNLIILCIISSLIMSICAVLPKILLTYDLVDPSLSSMPTSIMILVGIWCVLYREFEALKQYDSYKLFI